MSKSDKLSPKEMLFCEAYLGAAKGNGTKAAELAGYSGSKVTLATTAHSNLRKPKIRAHIEALLEADSLVATRIERQRFWSEMMRSQEVEPRDRLKASELLGKTHGDFLERVEHSGDQSKPIVMRVEDMSDDQLRAVVAGYDIKLLGEGEDDEQA